MRIPWPKFPEMPEMPDMPKMPEMPVLDLDVEQQFTRDQSERLVKAAETLAAAVKLLANKWSR